MALKVMAPVSMSLSSYAGMDGRTRMTAVVRIGCRVAAPRVPDEARGAAVRLQASGRRMEVGRMYVEHSARDSEPFESYCSNSAGAGDAFGAKFEDTDDARSNQRGFPFQQRHRQYPRGRRKRFSQQQQQQQQQQHKRRYSRRPPVQHDGQGDDTKSADRRGPRRDNRTILLDRERVNESDMLGGYRANGMAEGGSRFDIRQDKYNQYDKRTMPSTPMVKGMKGRERNRDVMPTNIRNSWVGMLIERLNSIESRKQQYNINNDTQSLTDDPKYVDEIETAFKEIAQGREEHIESRAVTTMLTHIDRLDVALKVFKLLQKRAYFSEQTNNVWAYSTLMAKCSRFGYWNVARDLLQELLANGVTPNDLTVSCCLSACLRAKRYDAAIEIFKQGKELDCISRVAFNTMINIYTLRGEWKEALKVVLDMWSSGITPDTLSYDQAFKACEVGRSVDDALRLLDEMETMGVEPSNLTLSRMLAVAEVCNDYQIAMQMIKRVRALGVEPNIMNYRIAIIACQKGGRQDITDSLMEEMKASMDRWTNMSQYTAAMNAFEIGQQPAMSLVVYEKMKEKGLLECADEKVYNSVISACDAEGKWERAMELFEESKLNGVEPNVFTYTSIIGAVSKPKKREHVLRFLDDMKRDGVFPNERTYSAALVAFELRVDAEGNRIALEDDWIEALKLRRQIQRNGMERNPVVASQLVGIMWDSRFYKIALKMLLEYEKADVHVTKIQYDVRERGQTATFDLHGITPGCALAYMLLAFLRLRRRPDALRAENIDIVTGWGKHAKSMWRGVTVKEAIEDWLYKKECPMIYLGSNDGRFHVSKAKLVAWLNRFPEGQFLDELMPGMPERTADEEELKKFL